MKVLLFCLWIATGAAAYYFYQAQTKAQASADEAMQSLQAKDQATAAKLTQDINDLKKQVSDGTTFQSKYEADETTIQGLRSQLSDLHAQVDSLQAKVATTAAMGGTNTSGSTAAATVVKGDTGENWTTTDGHFYKNVKVLKVEPDVVTILDDDGGAGIPIATLARELQTRFNYDPAKAQEASAAKAQATADAKKQMLASLQKQSIDAAPSVSDADALAAVQQQIVELTATKASLTADMEEKYRWKGAGHGAYEQIINDDQSQMDQIDAKMTALNQKIIMLNRKIYISAHSAAPAPAAK